MEEKLNKGNENVSAKGLKVFLIVQIFILFLTTVILLQGGYYSWSLFVAIPFSIGLTVGYYTRIAKSLSWIKLSFKVVLVIVIICFALLALGLEGAICILMAIGLIVIPSLLGLLFGFLIRKIYLINFFLLVVLLNSGFITYDIYATNIFEEKPTISIIVNQSISNVRRVLHSQFNFNEHPNVFFKNGISYPRSMQVQLVDEQICLVCKLNAEEIALPITEMSDTVLRFTAKEDVVIMQETNPFHEVNTKHQQGYFKIVYGEFKLKRISDQETLLTATTHYQYKITPQFYWRWWTNYIVQEMHKHVIKDIKLKAESFE